MFYELIIGLGVLVYVIWKYVLSTKTEKYVQDTKSTAVQSESVQSEIKKSPHTAAKLPLTRSVSKTEEKLETTQACPHIPKDFESKLKTSLLKNVFEFENKQENLQSCSKAKNRHSKDFNESLLEDSVDHKTERLIRNSKNPEEWVNDLKKYFKTNDSKIEDELRSLSSEIVSRKEKNNDINIEHYFIDTKSKDDNKKRKVNKEPVKKKPARKNPTVDDYVRVQNDITIEPIIIQLNSIDREKQILKITGDISILNETPIYNIESNKADVLFGTNSNDLKLEQHFEEKSHPITDTHVNGDLIPPSELLKRQREKSPEKIGKRESPPKERFAEFLEKSILSDDKIQSIIQNLSLDKTENTPQEEQNIAEAKVEIRRDTISDKALKLQASIDLVADRIPRLNDSYASERNGTSPFSESKFKREKSLEPVDQDSEDNNGELYTNVEEKPLLKRLQKQSGFPAGLNFGSVIGELKNKTKNGGLKPVFKKFDSADTVDDAQACCFFLIFFNI